MLKRLLLATAAGVALAAPAQGFGVRAHLWIADQVYADLADCRLTIRGEAFEVPDEACEAIRRNRGAFLAGAIGPDAFPDLVVGQSIVHPGVEEGWQANQWLEHLLVNAGECPILSGPGAGPPGCAETAFAWGYAMHFAGDIFAHSYVNNYAGESFDFRTGGRGDELRHFRLEKYLDQFLPYEPDASALEVPSRFLARQLVQFDYLGARALTDEYFEAQLADPERYIREASRRLSSRAPATHLTTMLAVLEIAKGAKARAPRVLAHARTKATEALNALHGVEASLGLPESQGVPIDRESERFRRLPRRDRENLRRHHAAYQSASDEQRLADAMVVFTEEWVVDVERVTEQWILASLDFAQGITRSSGSTPVPYPQRRSMLDPYRRWLTCYSDVLRGGPYEAGQAICARIDRMGTDLNLADAALRAGMGQGVRSFYYRVLQFERYFANLLGRIAVRVVSIADGPTAQLLRDISDPASVSTDALDDAFDETGHGRIAFVCVSDWIDFDLGLRAIPPTNPRAECSSEPRTRETMDPMKFRPLEYALTLAKLSLLDQARVRQLAVRFGDDQSSLRLTEARRYSVLVDTVRSLDGNQQWQTISMPYPRRAPYDGDAPRRSAGYPLPNSYPQRYFGFPYYQTTRLRQTAFSRLFPEPFEGRILVRTEMQPPHYPYWPCPGDPLRGPMPAGARSIDSCPE